MQKKPLLLLLLLATISGNAHGLEISYQITPLPEYQSLLSIKTTDQNVGVDVNKLEVLVNNKMLEKKDFLSQRIGSFEKNLPNQDLLQAKKISILAQFQDQDFVQEFDLNVVKDENIVGEIKHEIPQQKGAIELAENWLQQTFWEGLILDNQVSIPNYGLIVCLFLLVLAILRFGKLI